MNLSDQQVIAEAIAMKDAAKSEAGQLYHRHVQQLIDSYIDQLLYLSDNEEDQKIVAIVRKLQGTFLCLMREGDTIHKGLQQGARLAEKARVSRF